MPEASSAQPQATGGRLIGIERQGTDAASREEQYRTEIEGLRRASAGGAPAAPPRPSAQAVFEDGSGRRFVVYPTADSAVAMPFLTGSTLPPDSRGDERGGFLPMDHVLPSQEERPPDRVEETDESPREERMRDPAPDGNDRAPDSRDVDRATPDRTTGSSPDEAEARSANEPSGASPEEASALAKERKKKDLLDELLEKAPSSAAEALINQLAESLASDSAGTLFNLSSLDPSKLAGGVIDGGIGGLVGYGTQAALNELWAVDDESSTEEQVAYYFAQLAVRQAAGWIAGGMAGFLKSALGLGKAGGLPKPPGFTPDWSRLEAVVASAADANGNVVTTGASSVEIVSLPAARVGDSVSPPGEQIFRGAETVEFEGMMAARLITSQSAVAQFLKPTVPTRVFIGGPSAGGFGPLGTAVASVAGTSPSKPRRFKESDYGPDDPIRLGPYKPNENDIVFMRPDGELYVLPADGGPETPGYKLDDASNQVLMRDLEDPDHWIPIDMNQPVRFDDQGQPYYPYPGDETQRIYFDPKAAEFRLWSDKEGSASTAREFNSLWTVPEPLRSMFVAGDGERGWFGQPYTPKNWYLLGGLLDLGSAARPNAGNIPFWWIPDKLFGFDMSRYYIQHDYTFDPKSLWNLPQQLNVELQAFLAGLEANPGKLPFNIIFSSATSTVMLITSIQNDIKMSFR